MNNLSRLDSWNDNRAFISKSSAQSYMGINQSAFAASGSACGAGDDGKSAPKPTSCGAGDDGKSKPKPTGCGSSCGAGDDGKTKPKPSGCGSSCGAGNK